MKYWIYFLLRDGVIVYIGQTQHPRARVYNHRADKAFDSHRIIECPEDKLNYYEERWIKRFKPEYNKFNAPYVPCRRKFLNMNKEKSMRLFMSVEQAALIDNRSQELNISKTEYILGLLDENDKLRAALKLASETIRIGQEIIGIA